MRSTLYVHIGAPKCASTSIQQLLFDNAEILGRHGFAVSDENMNFGSRGDNPLWFIQDLIDRNAEEGPQVIADRVKQLAGRRGIVSAENLNNPLAAPLFTEAAKHADIELLYVVRRQDDWIYSAWKQWYSKVGISLSSYVESALTIGEPDYPKTLQAWNAVVPRGNIRVVSLDLLDPASSIELETLKWLGLSGRGDDFKRTDVSANESFDFRILDLLSRHKGAYDNPHDRRIEEFLAQFSRLSSKQKFQLPDELSARVMERFRADNLSVLGPEATDALYRKPRRQRASAIGNDRASDHDFVLACLLEAAGRMSAELAASRAEIRAQKAELEQIKERLKRGN